MFWQISRAKWTLRRAIYAHLKQRYIFNFRLPSSTLRRMLPVTWLKPQVKNGYSIISFCILDLEGLTIWPLPTFLGLGTISCAYRCGVIDESQVDPVPSVFI